MHAAVSVVVSNSNNIQIFFYMFTINSTMLQSLCCCLFFIYCLAILSFSEKWNDIATSEQMF